MLSAYSFIYIQLRPFLKRKNSGFMRSSYCLFLSVLLSSQFNF